MVISHPILFISLGPGDPELITLKALNALRESDVIFYPTTGTLSRVSSRALDIMEKLPLRLNKLRPFFVPMSKNRKQVLAVYNEVASQAYQLYMSGEKVAIVAEGDAGFYSTTYYIYERLANLQVETKRLAGIPAFIAAGTLANLHVAALEQELHVVPGTITEHDLKERILQNHSIVIMKTSLCEEAVKKVIKQQIKATFHYFENVGCEDREFYTTDTEAILQRRFPYFSLMIIQQK